MNLWITGFLIDDSEDSSLKYDLDVPIEFERAVMDMLGWKSLAEECDGVLPLTPEQIEKLSSLIETPLPQDLDLFIEIVSG